MATVFDQVFDQQQLQLALLSLPSLLQKQDAVSCVIVLGINMFYHQTRVVMPTSHRAHVARLVATAEVLKTVENGFVQYLLFLGGNKGVWCEAPVH